MKKPFPTAWLAAGLVFSIMLAAVAWWLWLRTPPLPEGLIQANGRIEGDHFIVAGKAHGFSVSAVCTRAASPSMPRRMSVTPAAIHIRVPVGSPIIAAAPGSRVPYST